MDVSLFQFIGPQALMSLSFGYLLGSIPVGLLLSNYVKGIDPRTIGSGNIGATNVTRAAGLYLGIWTLVLDLLKGATPVLLANSLGFSPEIQVLSGFFAFLGHCFPVWLNFRGGKGVATGFGILLVVSVPLAVLVTFGFLIGYAIKRQVGFGSVFGCFFMLGWDFFVVENELVAWIFVMMGMVIIFKHRKNIKSWF